MRTKKMVVNLIAGFGGQLTGSVLSFITRIIFTRFLSANYLGVNGLFTNILTILSLSELGIGTTMTFFLYKPVAENDEIAIGKFMNLYRNAYRIIALIVFIAGMMICPFLDFFIEGESGIEHLRLIYVLYLLDVVCSYLLSYKNSVFQAEQKIYIRLIIEQIVNIVRTFVQIVVLILSKNFIVYLLMQMIGSLIINLWVSYEVDKTHPYLKKIHGLPDKKMMKEVIKNVKAMSMHKVGSVIVQGTDDLLMSAFVGLTSVGIYSNYSMIINNINTLFFRIYNALIGGVGNLAAKEEGDKIYEVYCTLDFSLYLFFSFVSAGLICFFNPVILLLFGESYLFSMEIVICIVVNFYITGMRQINLMFREAMGLFWHDRYKPVIESIVNIVVSIYLVRRYEVIGIFLGTIFSSVTIDLWVEPYILMRYGMKKKWKEKLRKYFGVYLLRIVIAMAISMVSWLICSKISDKYLGGLLVKIIIFSISYLLGIVAVFSRRREFKNILGRVKILVENYLIRRSGK